MSVQPPPSNTSGNYNPTDWTNGNQYVDEAYISENFLSYPSAQGQETLADTIISGTLTAQSPATFSDLTTFNNGIDISTTAGIKFSDDTVQTTAFIEANYAQLNTDNTFLAPYQNTFAGDSSTGNANAPIKLTNGVVGEYATLYLNPSVGEDITLYTNQTPNGGLTIRGANGASFTMNPANIQGGAGCSFINPLSLNANDLSGLANVYGNNGGTISFKNPVSLGTNATATTQASGNSSTLVATTAFVQDAVQVSGVQVGDSPLLWSGNNTWQTNIGDSTYVFPYGLNVGWNAKTGTGDSDLICIGGTTGNPLTGGLNVYLSTEPTTITSATVPKFQVNSNNVNIPTGSTYSINGINILTPYSTTVQMNSAISTATSGLAPINSPTFTGLPLLTTTPTAGISNANAIANLQYITNQGFATVSQIPSLAGYALLASPIFTGNPQAPTPLSTDNDTSIATTAYVQTAISGATTTTTITSTVATVSGNPVSGAVWTWQSVLNTTQGTTTLTLNQPAPIGGGSGTWNFVLNFNTTLFPSGGGINPTLRSGSYLIITNTSLGIQYDPLQINAITQTSITISSGGTSNYLSGNYNVSSYIIIQYN